MNTVGPYHNRQETYSYFSLPFCRGDKTTISHYHETLGEALQGTELEFSGLDIDYKGSLIYYIIVVFCCCLICLLFYNDRSYNPIYNWTNMSWTRTAYLESI